MSAFMINETEPAIVFVVTQVCLALLVYLLSDFRSPSKRWGLLWMTGIAAITLANLCLILSAGHALYIRLAVFTVTIPYMLWTVWTSRFCGMRAAFHGITILFIGCVGVVNGELAGYLFPGGSVQVITRLLSYLILFFLVKAQRSAYLQMLRLLDRGWGLLCVPIFQISLMIYAIRRYLIPDPALPYFLFLYGLLFLGVSIYGIISLLFRRVRIQCEERQSGQLLSAQVEALERQMAAVAESEERARIYRHDTRHILCTVEQELKMGQTDKALILLGDTRERVKESRAPIYCRNLMVNASLIYYLDRARAEGTEVDVSVNLPAKLNLDAIELAVAMSNILENAIRACGRLPEGEERRIMFSCTYKGGQIAVQSENPCPGELRFGPDGLPLSEEGGEHGVGLRSIAAFARKYGAGLHCWQKDNVFYLQMLVDDRSPEEGERTGGCP